MALKIVNHVERPDLNDRWNEAADTVWPEFALHDDFVGQFWGGLRRHFPDCQVYLYWTTRRTPLSASATPCQSPGTAPSTA